MRLVPCMTALMGHRIVSWTEHHPLCTLTVLLRTRANTVFGWGGVQRTLFVNTDHTVMNIYKVH